MKNSTFELFSLCLVLTIVHSSPAIASGTAGAEWFSLFDGKTLAGWKSGGNSGTFSVRDGMIVADGLRSHLFYAGPIEGHDFTNFELKVDVKTMPKTNSGIYFHTEYQQTGFPAKGYEVQINNTYPGTKGYRELRKTGSIYGVRDVFASCARDEAWFTVHIIVEGRRTRLWIANEVHIDDEQEFMDMYVGKIVTILENEPIDIFVNPTFLPAVIAERYDELWTRQRMLKVAQAAVKNGVAIEINARYRIPSVKFIKLAKQAGAKFAFGTNNGGRELGHLEYSLDVAQQCGLTKDDMFVPKPYGEKPIQTKK